MTVLYVPYHQDLALTVLWVPCSLDSGPTLREEEEERTVGSRK